MSYGKNRQWTAVLFNENMREGWQEEIENLVQLPYAYCVHDKGLALENGEHRKVHTHVILVWPAPTTQKHAIEVFDRLSAPGKKAFAAIEPVYNAGRMYDYLIHDTEDCRKKGKYQFSRKERITGNNYDIGAYVQVSMTEKNEMFDALTDLVLTELIGNFAEFISAARIRYPEQADLVREVVRGHSGYFERLTRGIYLMGENLQKTKAQRRGSSPAGAVATDKNVGGIANV